MFRVLILCFSVATMLVAGPVGWCGAPDDASLGDASLFMGVDAFSLPSPVAFEASVSDSLAGLRTESPTAPSRPTLDRPPQFTSA